MSMRTTTGAAAGGQKMDALSEVSRVELHDEPKSNGKAFPTLLLAVFFVALLLSLIAGVTVYKHISDLQNASNAQREGLGVIVNTVRANDATSAIAQGEGPEGKSLVIVEHASSGTYETRIYRYEGSILQEYSIAGSAYTPEKASKVAESTTFSFSFSDGLLSISTDQGTTEVALRYTQGGN